MVTQVKRKVIYTLSPIPKSLSLVLTVFNASLSSRLPRLETSASSLPVSCSKEQTSPQTLTGDLRREHPSPSQKPSLV